MDDRTGAAPWRVFVLILAVLCACGTSADAQVPTDTVRAASTPDFAPLPPIAPPTGRPVVDSLPARTPAVTPLDNLEEVPGTFLYDLGAVAWPHGWSRHGLAPHRWDLTLDDLPYTDPLTGRPRIDLVPPSFVQRPRLGISSTGHPDGVHLRWREYLFPDPVTELRFRRDSNGLQNIEVAHSQLRRLEVRGRPALLHTTFGYGGRATRGVYDGSDVERGRFVWGRLQFRRNRWTVTLSDVSVRHKIGLHGGVEPPLSTFSSIYRLPLAISSSQTNDARHRTFRNDLTLRVRAPLLARLTDRPTTLTARWTANTFAFETDFDGDSPLADTTWDVRTHGFHGLLQQSLRVNQHRLRVRLRGTWQMVGRSNVPGLEGTRQDVHLTVHDSLRLGRTALHLAAGAHATSIQTYPSATVRAERALGPVTADVQADVSGQPVPWLLDTGFSTLVEPMDDAPGPTDLVGRIATGLSWSRGVLQTRVEAFATGIRRPVDLYTLVPANSLPPVVPDTVAVRAATDPFYRVGVTLTGGWREDARRGLYARGRATAQHMLTPTASPLHERRSETLPPAYGRLRLGARFRLFQDLETDLYVQARGWMAMNSRWFHPPTGLLAVPPAEAPILEQPGQQVGPSGTLDATAEATLRSAKLSFTFENVLGRSEVQAGTFVVPVYPLPTRQFRFGVHWPIFN